MVVVNPRDFPHLSDLAASKELNTILRFPRAQLPDFADVVAFLIARSRRINVILLDIDRYTDADFAVYEAQLQKLIPSVVKDYQSGKSPEVSCLTDRIFLKQMRNCEAGLAHLTVSSDGRLYLCPAFQIANADGSAGSIVGSIAVPDAHLLTLHRAPICMQCDAFHCKRCFWLNKHLTGEINIPSRQQCVLSHLEREASRGLVERLRGIDGFRHVPRIQPIDYLDPLEIIQRADGYAASRRPDDPQTVTSAEDETKPMAVQHRSRLETVKPPQISGDVDRKRVGKVSLAERDEIQQLFERRNGLHEMARALAGMDQAKLTTSALYERLLADLSEVTKLSQKWWNDKAVEYGWESAPNRQWEIDFDTCTIYLVESEARES